MSESRIFPLYIYYISTFACLKLLLSQHFGYLAHHFQSVDTFFTYFTTGYLEPESVTERRKTEKRNDAAGLLIKDFFINKLLLILKVLLFFSLPR